MKKLFYLLGLVLTLAVVVAACQKTTLNDKDANVENTFKAKPDACTTIQSGDLLYAAGHYLDGEPLTTGYDIFGYNYQAHMFNGTYANVYLGGDGFPPYEGDDEAYLAANPTVVSKWYWPYRETNLVMKWNDAWLSNKDCDDTGLLDRHYGFDGYIGSGAWETNHMWGTYEEGGEICEWDYFTKIIAVPDYAILDGGIWYNTDGTEIGPDIWGQFATIQTVENDPCAGLEGLQYNSPDHSGLGGW